jgi:hypothetical protein
MTPESKKYSLDKLSTEKAKNTEITPFVLSSEKSDL